MKYGRTVIGLCMCELIGDESGASTRYDICIDDGRIRIYSVSRSSCEVFKILKLVSCRFYVVERGTSPQSTLHESLQVKAGNNAKVVVPSLQSSIKTSVFALVGIDDFTRAQDILKTS